MSDTPSDEITIEVQARYVDEDPKILVYHVETVYGGPQPGVSGLYTEGFGSVEQLQAYLKGAEMVLTAMGYMVPSLGWHGYPGSRNPRGRRWKISRSRLIVAEDLDEDGNVIRI